MGSLILIILVLIPGVWSGSWRVTPSDQCALKGTSAVIKCQYDYPFGHIVTSVDWVKAVYVSGCPSPINTVWFRDGQLVPNPVFQVRKEDAGRYHCAILGHQAALSASVALEVKYAPTEVTLSMTPSVVKGSSVTFTCSSDANPPVTQRGYSLYRDGRFVSSGQNHTVSDLQPAHSGLYSCQAWNNISRGGVLLFNSAEVHLDVQYRPENISLSLNPPHVVEGSRVNLTCSSDAKPAADYTWFRSSASTLVQVGSGQVLSVPSVEMCHAGLYLCQARNHLGERNSTTVLLVVKEETHADKDLKLSAGLGVSLFVTLLLLLLLLFWLKRRTRVEKKTFTSYEDQVTYSTVTIKLRQPSSPLLQSRAEKDSVIYASLAQSS